MMEVNEDDVYVNVDNNHDAGTTPGQPVGDLNGFQHSSKFKHHIILVVVD